jgi:3-carboxy-cis,cis-muconate cycloisomerase
MTSVFEHPWLGTLFGDLEISAHLSAETQLVHMVRIEAAHSRVLGNEGAALAVESAAVAPQDLRAGSAVDGLPVPELVRRLKGQIPQELHADIHQGLTSQDVIDTAFVLSLVDILKIFVTRLGTLQSAMAQLDKDHGSAHLMGRTRMQAALPITVSDRLSSWSLPLADHLIRLHEISPRLLRMQCGGPVGLSLGNALAARLGLVAPARSWHTMRDGFGELASWLSLVSGSVGKMGVDISLMAQQGIDEISLVGGGSSSAMPHKQNPILAELLVTLARYNAIQVSGMHQAMVHEQERSGAAWVLEWMILPNMLHATARSLTAGCELIEQIEKIGT